MLEAVLLLILGAIFLIAGAESAVRGAARFAIVAGVPAFVLGALLFGIDLEGLSAALLAAARGQTEIAAGAAFGTIVFLFGVGFAFALLLSKGPIPSPSTWMVIAPSLPVVAAGLAVSDRYVSRLEGALLVALYGSYVFVVLAEGRPARAPDPAHEAEEVRGGARGAALLAVAGLLAVYGGAWLLVEGGIRVLSRTGLEAGFVGAAIIGTLASLDEVLLEVLPAVRGTPDLATGNLFGTVAAFTTAVLGLAAVVRPLVLDSSAHLAFLAAAALYAIVSVVFLLRGRVSKTLGWVLLACYVAWLAYTASL